MRITRLFVMALVLSFAAACQKAPKHSTLGDSGVYRGDSAVVTDTGTAPTCPDKPPIPLGCVPRDSSP